MILVGLSNSENLPTEIVKDKVPKILRNSFPKIKFYKSNISGKILMGGRTSLNEIEKLVPRVNYDSSGDTIHSIVAIKEIFNDITLTLPILQLIESETLYARGDMTLTQKELCE